MCNPLWKCYVLSQPSPQQFQYPTKYTNFKYHQISFERHSTGGIPNPIVIVQLENCRSEMLLWTKKTNTEDKYKYKILCRALCWVSQIQLSLSNCHIADQKGCYGPRRSKTGNYVKYADWKQKFVEAQAGALYVIIVRNPPAPPFCFLATLVAPHSTPVSWRVGRWVVLRHS